MKFKGLQSSALSFMSLLQYTIIMQATDNLAVMASRRIQFFLIEIIFHACKPFTPYSGY